MRGSIDRGVRGVLALLLAVLGAVGCYSSNQEEVGGDSHFLRPCTRVAQCKDLGDEYACVAGHCQVSADASTPSKGASSTQNAIDATDAMKAMTASTGGPMTGTTPLVMFLIDTSASMERTSGCACSTPACEECLPRCSEGERNRWAQALEVLTGTYDDFACEALERTAENGSTYDIGFSMPYHRPSGTQRDDGMFDTYRERLRFGLSTFDGFDTFVGAAALVPVDAFDFELSAGIDGLWSYNPDRAIPDLQRSGPTPSGDFFYPGCDRDYFMDTGIRNESADEGALLAATAPMQAGEVNDAIQASLLHTRPYGGTPIAAALDDLYYFMNQDPKMAVERAQTAPKHVVLVTDGMPDTDYRDFGCDCATEKSQTNPSPCGGPADDPAKMHCPYPAPEQAARALRCGQDPERCDETGVLLHVVGFSIMGDTRIRTALDAIAMAGGDQAAHFADDEVELRDALEEVLANIAQ